MVVLIKSLILRVWIRICDVSHLKLYRLTQKSDEVAQTLTFNSYGKLYSIPLVHTNNLIVTIIISGVPRPLGARGGFFCKTRHSTQGRLQVYLFGWALLGVSLSLESCWKRCLRKQVLRNFTRFYVLSS